MFGTDEGNPGPVYRSIERALWALTPVLLLLIVMSYASSQAAHIEAEAGWARHVAAENAEYCTKWDMPPGSGKHLGCIRDLVAIRARAEQRLRDQAAAMTPF